MNRISPYKTDNLVLNLAFDFALAIIEYTEVLEGKRKFKRANQLFRSVTSIHANIREAQNAESKADCIHKMKLAAEEAEGWLLLCQHANSYPNSETLLLKLASILKLLNKIIGTSKKALAD